jgi:acyl-CoA thioester hydrolase
MITLTEGSVRAEWIDYNGHLYDGYYAVIFAEATDAFLIRIGLDEATRTATRHTIYTLETHVCFLREMKLGAPFRIAAQLLDLDQKRVRLFLTMHDSARDIVAATSEQLLMSIDQSGEAARSAPWLERCAKVLQDLAKADEGLPHPPGAGKGISLRRS